MLVLEQEIASLIKFILDSAGNPAPYYNEVKENFVVPSIYFPSPEIDSDGETFNTYRLGYDWRIKFFHKTTEDAHAMALTVLTALKGARNCVPLIDYEGNPTNENLRIDDPSIKKLDSGVYQLYVSFDSRRPYNDPEYVKSQKYTISDWSKSDVYYEKPFIDKALLGFSALGDFILGGAIPQDSNSSR